MARRKKPPKLPGHAQGNELLGLKPPEAAVRDPLQLLGWLNREIIEYRGDELWAAQRLIFDSDRREREGREQYARHTSQVLHILLQVRHVVNGMLPPLPPAKCPAARRRASRAAAR